MLGSILLVILIIALIGAIPAWPYSSGWGYRPLGILGTLLIILLILFLLDIVSFQPVYRINPVAPAPATVPAVQVSETR